MKNLLIVCPLKKEFQYFVSAIEAQGHSLVRQTLGSLPVVHVPSKNLIISVGGHGKVQFAVQTQFLISNHTDLKGMICVGAGGGLADFLKVGDLVIAEKTIEHDYTEKFQQNSKQPEFQSCPQLLSLLSSQTFDYPFSVHVGSIASGDEDIVDHQRATQLFEQTGALAVAWEGSGGARASKFNNIPFLEIRAITDNAKDSVAQSFLLNLQKGMENAALAVCCSIEH